MPFPLWILLAKNVSKIPQLIFRKRRTWILITFISLLMHLPRFLNTTIIAENRFDIHGHLLPTKKRFAQKHLLNWERNEKVAPTYVLVVYR